MEITEFVDKNDFIKLVKPLLDKNLFPNLRYDSAFLYSFFLDRAGLSNENRWKDERGIYILFSKEKGLFDWGVDRIESMIENLVENGLLLVEIVYVNGSRQSRYYVKPFSNHELTEYFKRSDIELFQWVKVPAILFTHPLFKNLTIDSIILYCLYLDRLSLSLEYDYKDVDGNYYVDFDDEEIQDFLGWRHAKASKVRQILKDVNLIDYKLRKQKKALIYPVQYQFLIQSSSQEISKSPLEKSPRPVGTSQEISKSPLEKSSNNLQEISKSPLEKSPNNLQEISKSPTNHTYPYQTNIYQTESNHNTTTTTELLNKTKKEFVDVEAEKILSLINQLPKMLSSQDERAKYSNEINELHDSVGDYILKNLTPNIEVVKWYVNEKLFYQYYKYINNVIGGKESLVETEYMSYLFDFLCGVFLRKKQDLKLIKNLGYEFDSILDAFIKSNIDGRSFLWQILKGDGGYISNKRAYIISAYITSCLQFVNNYSGDISADVQ